MSILRKIVSGVLLISAGAAQSALIEVLPSSYTIDKATDCGTYCYHDESGSQLIDGSYGTAPWSANLGNGNAYEWLGWVNDNPVNIDFNFGSSTNIDVIKVGTVQDHTNDVVVPNISIFSSFDGAVWSFIDSIITPESSVNNNQYFTLELNNLNINDQYVRVAATHSLNGPWTFIDEVDFYTDTTSVSEPASFAILGLGLVGLGFARRKQKLG